MDQGRKTGTCLLVMVCQWMICLSYCSLQLIVPETMRMSHFWDLQMKLMKQSLDGDGSEYWASEKTNVQSQIAAADLTLDS